MCDKIEEDIENYDSLKEFINEKIMEIFNKHTNAPQNRDGNPPPIVSE